MERKKFLIRADGDSEMGFGHLYRAMAIAEIYRDVFGLVFVMRSTSSRSVIPSWLNSDELPATLAIAREPAELAKKYPPQDYTLICDGYQFDVNYQQLAKSVGYQLLVIDDFARGETFADIVINHAASVKPSDYKAVSGTLFGLGTKFAILRQPFLKAAAASRQVNDISTVFVSFGGADPFRLAEKAVRGISEIPGIKKIHVLAGNESQAAAIAESAEEDRVSTHHGLSAEDIVGLLMQCDLAVTSASTTLYEVCTVKMPVLAGYYVDNQKHLYVGLAQKGAIFEGGDFRGYSPEDFRERVESLIADKAFSKTMDAQAQLFDSKITGRFHALLGAVDYRRANSGDLMQVFEWSNDPLTRSNSYSTALIELEGHGRWFNAKLNDPNALLLIASVNGSPAGLVRYELRPDAAVVGIMIGKDFRGLGLAQRLLTDTYRLYREKSSLPVRAYIKKSNAASVRSFEKAGYRRTGEELVNKVESYIYELSVT